MTLEVAGGHCGSSKETSGLRFRTLTMRPARITWCREWFIFEDPFVLHARHTAQRSTRDLHWPLAISIAHGFVARTMMTRCPHP